MLSVTLADTGFELKKVSWKGIYIREYDVTVGDHPLCRDNLPLSLDWSHSKLEKVKTMDCGRERKSNFPKRLSYEDRRRRIFGDPDEGESKEQDHPPSVQVKPKQASSAGLGEFLEREKIETGTSMGVIYCRHVKDRDEEENEEEDDYSLAYFLRRFTGMTEV
jgi:hypothetical protein